MADITQILESIQQGHAQAPEQLLPLVYEDLRRLAAKKMSHERPGQTLQATALVHEAWLKIAGNNQQAYNNREHFFRAAAAAMQRILVDIARRKNTEKHGANAVKDELHESRIVLRSPADELLAVHEALEHLTQEEPEAAEIARCRYFVGLTVAETAEALDLAPRTVDRHWAFARAWLKDRVRATL